MKCVLVTGAGGGMGLSITRRLIDGGYRVFALDRREFDCPGATKIICDVTSDEEVARAVQEISGGCDELYAVVHTAGIYDLDSLVEMDEERFLRIFNVNLFGVYRLNRHLLPLMKQGSRVLITTSELAPLDPLPFTGVYAITKAALEKYAYSLRMELNLLGISVSVIRPGAVSTTLLGDSMAALDRFCRDTKIYSCNAERFKKIVNSVEARSVPAERIADVVLRTLSAKKTRFVYKINRNHLLLLLNALPDRLQVFIIKQILK